MFALNQYELLDFGDARRLERFGALVLDRPCPAAEGVAKADPASWEQADAQFVRVEGKEGQWLSDRPLPERWTISHGPASLIGDGECLQGDSPSQGATGGSPARAGEPLPSLADKQPVAPRGESRESVMSPFCLTLELKRTEFGHLGVFPEQAANWDWLADRIAGARETHESRSPEARRVRETHQSDSSNDPPPLEILNLFAYTGASTLTAAAAGARVVHVDAARNVVAWARRNAELSGMAKAPIRWIAEDAVKFVKRELRRGSRYDAVILDPPSYGHGPRGEVWRLSKHLAPLLRMCGELTSGRRRFVLLTCHTPNFGPARLERLVSDTLGEGRITAGRLTLQVATGRSLPSGVVVRWEAG